MAPLGSLSAAYPGPPFASSALRQAHVAVLVPDSSGDTGTLGTTSTTTESGTQQVHQAPARLDSGIKIQDLKQAHRLAPLTTPSASRRPKLHRSTTSNPTIPADRPQRPDYPHLHASLAYPPTCATDSCRNLFATRSQIPRARSLDAPFRGLAVGSFDYVWHASRSRDNERTGRGSR